MPQTTDDRVLEISRTIPAAPDAVFDAWVDPAQLVRWWGPEGVTTPHCDLDPRAGGNWTTTMRTSNGEMVVSGVYTAVERPHRLAFSWAWTQEDGSRGHETVVEVTFEAVAEGTRMRLLQQRFATTEHRDNHRMGWGSSFNDLEKLFAS